MQNPIKAAAREVAVAVANCSGCIVASVLRCFDALSLGRHRVVRDACAKLYLWVMVQMSRCNCRESTVDSRQTGLETADKSRQQTEEQAEGQTRRQGDRETDRQLSVLATLLESL